MNSKTGPKVRVIAFGSFDGFHPGHAFYLRNARKLGDELVVIVARDATIAKVKHHKPHYSEDERLAFAQNCIYVDHAYLGNNANYFEVLSTHQPHIIALGYDQQTFSRDLNEELRKKGINATVVRLPPYHPEKYKSSKMH